MSKVVTVFSFARNGWVNYMQPRFSATGDGRAIPFGEVGTFRGQHFAYESEADAKAKRDPNLCLSAKPLPERMVKVFPAFNF